MLNSYKNKKLYMAINPHHTIEELNGTRCSVIEKKIAQDRAVYITRILESSNQTVISITDENGLVTVGVTDILFNPVHALYSKSLKMVDGTLVTPAIWNCKYQEEGFYWNY
jgi:hypothetical protein